MTRQIYFINQDPANPTLSEANQRTIRRVSRRVGAANRKEKGAVKRVNTIQVPEFLIERPHIDARLAPTLLYTAWGRRLPDELSIFLQPDLTRNLLCRAVAADANANPRRWVKVCRLASGSILHNLPQRYGYSRSLDDSIDCVLARIRYGFLPGTTSDFSEALIAQKYNRAIRSLANALTSAKVTWTAWYATLLLALFELLDYSSDRFWIVHSRGALDVLEALGPKNISTETEKAIFIAQVELMIGEAVFANVDVFLERSQWRIALESAIVPNSGLGCRSEPVVTFWMISSKAPGLYKRATGVVMKQDLGMQDEIMADLRILLDKYARWFALWYEDITVSVDQGLSKVALDGDDSVRRLDVFTRYLTYWSLTHRFLFATHPASAVGMEHEATRAAAQVVALVRSLEADSLGKLRIRVALKVARSIQRTTQQWSDPDLLCTPAPSGTIQPQVFMAWCTILGRATGSP